MSVHNDPRMIRLRLLQGGRGMPTPEQRQREAEALEARDYLDSVLTPKEHREREQKKRKDLAFSGIAASIVITAILTMFALYAAAGIPVWKALPQ